MSSLKLKGDSFVLDDIETLYVWNGSESNRMEQAKALDIATRVKNKDYQGSFLKKCYTEKKGRASLVMVNDAPPVVSSKFWDMLAAEVELTLLQSPKSSPSSAKGSKPLPKYHHLIASHTQAGTDEGKSFVWIWVNRP
jgi:hypothetical protein